MLRLIGIGDAAQLGSETLQVRGGCCIAQLDQHCHAGAPLEQHGRAVARALDEISLPLLVEGPVAGLGRTAWMLSKSGIWSCNLRSGCAARS